MAMLLSESLVRIRRILRDSEGAVFNDGALIRLWNETQAKFALESGLLETHTTLQVPPTTWMTYTHRWEEEFISGPSTLIYNFLSPYTYTQPWEPVATVGESPEVTGGFTCTHGWESFYANVQNRIPHYFPEDFILPSFMAYDQKPIEFVSRKDVEKGNTAFKTHTGIYPSVYIDDTESGVFYLYPKIISAYGIDDVIGEFGELGYDSSGELSFASDYGCVVFDTERDLSSNYGVGTYLQGQEDSIYLVYTYKPKELTSLDSEIEFSRWCVKYIECGVLSRLFKMESDLYNLTLSKHFFSRYELGLEVTRKLKSKVRTLRTYVRESLQGVVGGQRRLADLPSHYPSYWR